MNSIRIIKRMVAVILLLNPSLDKEELIQKYGRVIFTSGVYGAFMIMMADMAKAGMTPSNFESMGKIKRIRFIIRMFRLAKALKKDPQGKQMAKMMSELPTL